MYVSKIIHMAVERDKKGQIILNNGKAVATWLLPVSALFYRPERSVSQEQQLWREVAARLTLDALGFVRDTKNKAERDQTVLEAQEWFRYDTENMSEVFQMAGMPHEPIRQAVLKLMGERAIE